MERVIAILAGTQARTASSRKNKSTNNTCSGLGATLSQLAIGDFVAAHSQTLTCPLRRPSDSWTAALHAYCMRTRRCVQWNELPHRFHVLTSPDTIRMPRNFWPAPCQLARRTVRAHPTSRSSAPGRLAFKLLQY